MSQRQPDWTSAVQHLCASDPKLAAMIQKIGRCEMRIRHEHSIFYTLLRSIVYQQLAGSAAAAILARVEAAIGTPGVLPNPQQLVATPDETLRAAGLSRNKLLAVKDLAAKTIDGTVPAWPEIDQLSNEEIIERCVQVRGIGRWTVEMLLIFRLGRLDVLPVDDYGVRKGFQFTFRMRTLPTKKQMVRKGERWRPYRSVASWYFWQIADMPENRAREAAARKRAAKELAKDAPVPKKVKAVKKKSAAMRKKKSVPRKTAKKKTSRAIRA
jgi:3-methyladenine DNA glycosylase/8-oxoguanine DNA glycosylase